MAPSSSSSNSSKLPSAIHPPSTQSTLFTPIQECEKEEQEDDFYEKQRSEPREVTPIHQPTPLHVGNGKPSSRKRHESCENNGGDKEDGSISCYKCRPHSHRDKISVVPLDNNGVKPSTSFPSPNGILKSIFNSLTKKSPKSMEISPAREEQWKIAVAELSNKLSQATRKRDEALMEASRLKHSMTEVEKKLNKLEIYCQTLKSGFDEFSNKSPHQIGKNPATHVRKTQDHAVTTTNFNEIVIEQFLIAVAEARSSIRVLSRSLAMQFKHMGAKVYERLSQLLQPYDVKQPLFAKNPKSLVFYLEALLSKAFFEDFESIGFHKLATTRILNPVNRCGSNYASFTKLRKLTWEEVLSKGTRYFSEEFSGFCDRKMSEIVAMLGWNRAWPEPLLQAFFGASKAMWLVHLLGNSLHPGLPIFRVDKGMRFDPVYMEDMGGGDKSRKLVPIMVRIMVSPGFYVFGNVVKCKVLCMYNNNVNYLENDGISNNSRA